MPSQAAATLRSRYLEQAASDLEENRRLQRELAEKIEMLKQEEELLIDILALTERFPQVADSPASPVPADSKGAPPRERRSADETDVKSRTRQPLLGDLLTELLGGHQQPQLAQDLRKELLNKHPDREPSPQVVRNTLESLVAKGRIQRHKQKRSVTYTLIGSDA
ncbi:hypothetical protein AB0I54_28665 [Streptomyces sp. NPDC050625]|uniref:hypothetical protein n=1 Tax=Streptomyces sp. NPDC050625 TaxID=3154629 RepID=UPI003429F49D